jgi:3-dehydroquinate synthase
VTEQVCDVLQEARLPTDFPAEIDASAILAAAQRDKKTEAGRLRFVLARAIGEVFVSPDVSDAAVRAAIARHKRRSHA